MKSTFLSISIALSLLVLTSCKDGATTVKIDYKYASQPELITCKIEDQALIKEALYAFESDIREAYNKTNKNPERTFQGFVTRLLNKTFKANEVATKHSLKIAKALQQSKHYKNNLFEINGVFANCIFDNIKDNNLKTSLNALRKANSLRPNVVLSTFRNYSRNFTIDKNLTALLAFEYYYNQVMLLNEADVKTANKVDFNKVPSKQQVSKPVKTGHEGHNH